MFWHFLKVVYSRACESRGVWIKVRKLKFQYVLEKNFFLYYTVWYKPAYYAVKNYIFITF